MILRNSSTGDFEVYDISGLLMGTLAITIIGIPWAKAAFMDHAHPKTEMNFGTRCSCRSTSLCWCSVCAAFHQNLTKGCCGPVGGQGQSALLWRKTIRNHKQRGADKRESLRPFSAPPRAPGIS